MWTDGSLSKVWAVGGYVITGEHTAQGTLDLGEHVESTSNQAEYAGLLGGLRELLRAQREGTEFTEISIFCDSLLVVNHCSDKWKCRNLALKKMRDEVWDLCNMFLCDITFTWIPREENQLADAVSRSLYET
ncbi:MAG: reverse transcriptase-like protein [Sulfurovum sp.]|nr:reverse transcriptase-like protein [Sulfurovum sp.]